MAKDCDILDPSWMHLEGEFDDQVRALFGYVRLTREEVEHLRTLFVDLEDTLRTKWPGCEVVPFGSIVTGMGIKTSDVDCYVNLPYWCRTPGEKYVNAARNVLRRRPSIFVQLFAISSAKVPIVKFFHTTTQRHCDVSFKSPSGVRNSKLLCYLLHLDRRALDLAILVKYWSKVYNLTGTNLMPNYALTLLVIFYLQHLDILPPVHRLQAMLPNQLVDNWNTAFEEPMYVTDNEWSLYQILGGFFAFYSSYNFEENIISPFLGYSLVRDSFKKIGDVPEEFVLYKENVMRKACMPLKLDTAMCVQDPFDHSRNCTVAVFPKLAHKLIEYFRMGASAYEYETSDRFLKALLMARPPVSAPSGPPPGKKIQTNNKVAKPYRPTPNFKHLKKNLQHNLHTLYAQINGKQRGKR